MKPIQDMGDGKKKWEARNVIIGECQKFNIIGTLFGQI